MIQSPAFWILALCLPIVVWALPIRYRAAVIALASAALLATFAPLTVTALAGWSLAFYYLLRLPRHAGAAAVILVIGILSQLAAFKYLPPLLESIVSGSAAATILVPLGMSFFTFKLIHYSIEQRRGALAPHSFADFCCYVYLFPIFTAGPIERFDHFLSNREKTWSVQSASKGVTRIGIGLIKKFVIADLVIVSLLRGQDIESVMALLDVWPVYYLWAFLALSFLYLYMDFSGYCDIAIGTCKLLGIGVMENFDWPLLATNIGAFWKRWHMTLAGWCQTYVYMPTIGLTRNPFLAVYLTFSAIGLWHAGTLNYLCWGLYQATGVSVYLWFARLRRKRGWKVSQTGIVRYWGALVTFAVMSLGYCFTTTSGLGIVAAIRLFGRVLCLPLMLN